jgi:dienelactone hydrolase
MYRRFIIILIFLPFSLLGQEKTAADFGFTHLTFSYKNEPVDILIKSKKGQEKVKKPLFFFCQGSLPQPLIKYDEQGMYGVFPFNPDSLSTDYHLVLVSKPSIPLIANVKNLGNNFTYIDKNGHFPKAYLQNNLLSYYVPRNIAILKYLLKQTWVAQHPLVVAGHSEGSTIAAKMAMEFPKISHLIYSGGNPMGRILSIIQQSRATESDTDSTRFAEEDVKYWESIIYNLDKVDTTDADSFRTTFEFSHPPIQYLEKLKIPVLVTYGTKDWSMPYNDFLRVEMIRKAKKNFTFKAYIGLEHNFFPLKADGRPNYELFNWDKVALDWQYWLNKNKP